MRGGRHRRGVVWRERRQREPRVGHGIGHQAGLATGAAERTDAAAGQRTGCVEELQGFQKVPNAVRAWHAQARQQRGAAGIRAGDGGGVAERRGLGGPRTSHLQRHQRYAPRPRPGGHGLHAGHRVERLDMQPQRAHPVVLQKREREVGEAQLGLIAGRDHVGDGQAAPLHGDADGDVRGLHDDGDATLLGIEARATVLIRPQRNAIQEVDEAVAVRANEWHRPRRGHQRLLQATPALRFEKTGGVADGAAGARRGERRHRIDGGVAVDADEGGVRWPRQGFHRAERGAAGDLWARGMDRPNLALEAHPVALFDHPRRGRPADHGDARWTQQPV